MRLPSFLPPFLLICLVGVEACLPKAPPWDTGLEEPEADPDCPDGVKYLDKEIPLRQVSGDDDTPANPCMYVADSTDPVMQAFGNSTVIEVTTPDSPDVDFSIPGATFELSHTDPSSGAVTRGCYGNLETTQDFDGLYAHATWAMDMASAACTDACSDRSQEVRNSSLILDVCDSDGSTHLDVTSYDPLPPGLPVGATYTWARPGDHAFPGRFWYAILTRDAGRACVVTRWQSSPEAKSYSAVVLADELTQGGTTTYRWVDDAGLYFIEDGLTATQVAAGPDRVISGTTGSATKDAFYGLTGSFAFKPATGPGSRWPRTTLRVANHYCTRMRQAHPQP